MISDFSILPSFISAVIIGITAFGLLFVCIFVKPKKFKLPVMITTAVIGALFIAGGVTTAVLCTARYGWAIPKKWHEYNYETHTLISGDILTINIESKYADIKFESGDVLSFTVPEDCTFNTDRGTLSIETERPAFSFSYMSAPKIIITVPENKTFRRVVANAEAGNIEMDSVSSETIDVEADAGNAEFTNITATRAAFTVAAGRVCINSANVEDFLYVNAHAGEVFVSNCVCEKGELSITASMGSVTVQNSVCQKATISSNTGTINVDNITADELSLSTDMGTIKGTITGKKSEYNISVDVSLGQSNLKEQAGTTNKKLDVQTNMGSIDLYFADK